MYSISVLKGFLQFSDGKLDETEGYKCLFIVYFVRNRSAQASELLNNNNPLFVGRLYADKLLNHWTGDLIYYSKNNPSVQ